MHASRLLTILLLPAGALFGQGSLVLSSGTVSGGRAALNLTLTAPAGSQPAGIEWSLTYFSRDILSIETVAAGGAIAAGKSIYCAAAGGTYRCLLVGRNFTSLQNGVVAIVNVTLAAGVTGATLGLINTAGATPEGYAQALTGTGGVVTAPAPPTLSGLSCTPGSVTAGASSTCTVSLSKTGGGTVALFSSTAALTVPATVAVASGATAATFAATAGAVASDQTATVTASLNGESRSASILLRPAATVITALSCSPDPFAAGTLGCAIQLSQAAPAGGAPVTLQSGSLRLQLPAQVQIPAGQLAATFTIRVLPSDQDETPLITASFQGSVRTMSFLLTGIRPTALLLSTAAVQAGSWLDGEIRLTSSNLPDFVPLSLTSSSASVRIPASITVRPGQTRVTFQAYADAAAGRQNAEILGEFGQTRVKAPLAVIPSGTPVLSLPRDLATRFNEEVAFTVSAVDPQGLLLSYSAGALPDGARFDGVSGRFSWTPRPSQEGIYDLAFQATNSAGASSAGQVRIAVDSGKPVLTGLRNAASRTGPVCSPGSLASAEGRWLAAGSAAVSEPSGAATALNGTRVKVNGQYAPVVYASRERVDFVCPALGVGTLLTVSVENQAVAAEPLTAGMEAMAPGLFSLDGAGSGQGMVYLAGTSQLVTSRDYRALGQPAQSGDAIGIRATGIGAPDGLPPVVLLGTFRAQVDSVKAVPGMAGVAEIIIRVPPGIEEGASVPLVVICKQPAGPEAPGSVRGNRTLRVRSNGITVAIESGR